MKLINFVFYNKIIKHYLSLIPLQKGVARYSMIGRIPDKNPACAASIPNCLKYTPMRGNRDPNAEKKKK